MKFYNRSRMENTADILNRYQRQIQTPGFGVPGQEALLRSRVLVFGAGMLASPVLTYLASMGIGTIGIVSDEIIKKEELPAAPIYFYVHAGKGMGRTAAKQLREINADTNVTLYGQALDRFNILPLLEQYDFIIDCGNNLQQSYFINDACMIAGKPMIYGAVSHPNGFVSVFNYKGSGTLRCLLAQADIAQLLQQQPLPGLAVLSAITGSLMANEAAKMAGEIGAVLYNRLLTINSFNNQQEVKAFLPVAENLNITGFNNSYASSAGEDSQPSAMRAISPQLLRLKIKYNENLQLIDMRNSTSREGNSWNYLHIPEDELLQRSAELHQDIMVVLISENGDAAKRICHILNKAHGFDNIYFLEGGFENWQQAF